MLDGAIMKKTSVSRGFCGAVVTGLLALSATPAVAQDASSGTAAPVTFAKDVAPILYEHCTTCHRPGEIAPMALITYEDARPWARAIKDNVVKGTMPPWHADPAHGTWSNDRRLSAAEKELIVRWVDAGAPSGDLKAMPPKPAFTEGWVIGAPDAVVRMTAPYDIPATGEIPYQYFEVPTNFAEDKWVQAFEIRPGDRSVVHHVLVYARPPQPAARRAPVFRPQNPPGPLSPTMAREIEEAKKNPQAARPQDPSATRGPLIAQIAPGATFARYPAGTAMLVPAGAIVTFQVHYTTSGKATTDQSSIGFLFAKEPPAIEIKVGAMVNPRFMIPAGAAHHPVESGMEFLEDVTLYSLGPHTHLRGKRWEYQMTYPDGRTETLLVVPQYDFNWQTGYVFSSPLRVPKGAILKAVAHYDNSKENKSNPDATKDVYWGDQTWEEMQYTGLIYSIDKDKATTAAAAKQ